jgi:hypothetical protein
VLDVHEELGASRVGGAGVRHCEGAWLVGDPRCKLVLIHGRQHRRAQALGGHWADTFTYLDVATICTVLRFVRHEVFKGAIWWVANS